MKFIEVTESRGDKILVNLEHVTDVSNLDGTSTTIYLDVYEKWCEGRDQGRIYVKETYDEIKGLIRQTEAAQ